MKHRVNITIDKELHDSAVPFAREVHRTDFSGYLTKLIVDDLRKETEAGRTTKDTHPHETTRQILR